MPKILLGGLALVLLAGVGWIAYITWQFNQPPFPLSRLEQLNPKLTTNDVRQILGVPADSWALTNDSGLVRFEWAYSRPSSWPIVYVSFRPDGTFERHRYDY
jgi:hypothetical protein